MKCKEQKSLAWIKYYLVKERRIKMCSIPHKCSWLEWKILLGSKKIVDSFKIFL
jgi:hypothetical protein